MANSATVGLLRVLLTANTAEFDAAMKRASTSAQAWSKDLKNIGTQAQNVGMALTKTLTLPLVGLAATSIKAFADFDAAMVKSTAIMGDLSDTMRNDLEKAARDVAKTTTFSAAQAAESYFFLASAGLDAAQSIKALPVVAAFAQAGAFDMARATDLLTDAQSALGLTIRDDVVKNMENMARVSDVLVKANTLANASVSQFSEALTNRAGAALRLLNKDMEEGVAVLAVFADQGVKGAEAGTRLDIVLRDLQRSSIKNREEWDKLGISVFDASGNVRNMADIIGDLERALGTMSDEQKRTTLMTLGFQDRSVAATMSLLGFSDAIRGYETNLRSAGGVTQEVADKQLQSFTAQMSLLWSRVTDVGIELGKALVPAIKVLQSAVSAVLPLLEGAVKAFTAMPVPVQMVGIALAGMVAAAGPALWMFGQLITAAGSVVGAFAAKGIAARALGGVMGALGTSSAALAGKAGALAVAWTAVKAPVVAAATAMGGWIPIAAAATAGLVLGRQGINDLGSAASSVGRIIVSFARDSLSLLGTALRSTGEALSDFWEWLKKTSPEMRALGESADFLRTHIGKLSEALGFLSEEVGKGNWSVLATSLRRTHPVLAEFLTALQMNRKEMVAQAETAEETARRVKAAQAQVSIHAGRELATMNAGLAENREQLKQSWSTFGAFSESMAAAGRATRDTTEHTNEQTPALGRAQTAADQYAESVRKLADSLKGVGEQQAATQLIDALNLAMGEGLELAHLSDTELRKIEDTMFAIMEAANRTGQPVSDEIRQWYNRAIEARTALRGFLLTFDQIRSIQRDVASWTPRNDRPEDFATNVRVDALPGLSGIADQLARDGGFFASIPTRNDPLGMSALFEGVQKTIQSQLGPTIMSALTGGGDVTRSIGGLLGGQLGTNIGKMMGPALTGVLGKTLGGAVGSVIPGLGTLLGSFAGSGLGKLFGGLFGGSQERKENKQATQDVRALGQELVKVHGSMENLKGLGQIVGMDITAGFGHQGKRGLEQFQRDIEQFQAKVAAFKQQFNRDLGGILQEAQGLGFKLPETLTPYLDQLSKLGLITSENAALLATFGEDSRVDFRKMEEAAKRYGIALDDLGFDFVQAKFTDAVTQILEDYDLLTRGGADVSAVLRGMANDVSELVQRSLRLGIAMPENMRPIIEQLIEMGLLLDANGEAITSLDGMTFGDPIKVGLERIADLLEALLKGLGIELPRVIAAIPDVDVDVNVNYREHGRPSPLGQPDDQPDLIPAREFAHGTKGYEYFDPRGEWVKLHGWEKVTPLGAEGPGGMGGGSWMSTTILQVDGRELGRVVSPVLPNETRRLGVRVRS